MPKEVLHNTKPADVDFTNMKEDEIIKVFHMASKNAYEMRMKNDPELNSYCMSWGLKYMESRHLVPNTKFGGRFANLITMPLSYIEGNKCDYFDISTWYQN